MVKTFLALLCVEGVSGGETASIVQSTVDGKCSHLAKHFEQNKFNGKF